MIIENRVIDLGLPSGTLWKAENEEGFYTFNEVVEKYGDSLPTKEQFEELKDYCKWEWVGNGYNVTGTNGNTIVLPAKGYCFYIDGVYGVGSIGFYLSSSPKDLDNVWGLGFKSDRVGIDYDNRCYYRSVRLVENTRDCETIKYVKMNNNIKEDYVSFEIAKLLKEKGFNVPEYVVGHVYRSDGALQSSTAVKHEFREYILAPTHQMAMKWLRKIHNIILDPAPNLDGDFNCIGSFCCLIYKEGFLITTLSDSDYTYEEAVEAALKYSLQNLI